MHFKTVSLLLIFSFCFFSKSSFAQDSSRIRISLLTCEPGEELYSIFGHSALRITDSNSVTDHVYNYGTFNFDDEGFYLKFLRGKLKYYVSLEEFTDFKNDYILQNRGITEQVLNFTTQEKIIISRQLAENIKEENKFYLYNFFLDNCTTRLRDIIVKNQTPTPELPFVMPAGSTFRDGLHKYQDLSDRPWTKLGMDLLLGTPADKIMTPAQQAYLPDNLMYELAGVKNVKPVSASQQLFVTQKKEPHKVIFTPFVLFTLMLLLFIILHFAREKTSKNILTVLDSLLFFIVGLFGIIFILMWAGTDHYMMKDNYNLFWAWPTHIIYAFVMHKNSKKIRTYFLLTAIFIVLLLCSWIFLAQQMNNALLPIILLMLFRAFAHLNRRPDQIA